MVRTTIEIEVKYDISNDFTLPDLTGVAGVAAVDEPSSLRLNATYYDTAGLSLAKHRSTLRRRTGGHDAGWTLKRPHGVDRSETTEPLAGRVRTVPPGLAAEVAGVIEGKPLVPVARIRTLRRERAVRDGHGVVLALIAYDTVTADALIEPPRHQLWRELEVELVDGPRDLLDAIGTRLRAAGAQPAKAPSKLVRTLGDRYPRHAAPAPAGAWAAGSTARGSAATAVAGVGGAWAGGALAGGAGAASRRGSDAVARRAVADYLRTQRNALVDNDPKVRVGDVDGVHDMRVATRRLRATLRTFRSVLPRDRTEPLRGELHWLAGVLGGVRDGDVIIGRMDMALDDLRAESPELIMGPVAARIRERLLADRAHEGEDLDSALDGARYADLRRSVDELPDLVLPVASRKALLRAARRALRRADRALERASHAPATQTGLPLPSPVPADPDIAFHEARKAYKRARYAIELVTPLIGSSGRRLSKRLATLQDVLGAHQDAVVAAALLRDFGVRAFLDGDNAFTYGLLYARQRVAGDRQMESLDRARRRANKRSLRRQLKP